jgi:hypothetical protein
MSNRKVVIMEKVKDFIYNNPVRVAAFVSSAVALLVAFVVPDAPTEPAIAFVLSALGLGEYAQRAENRKTDEALFTEVPEEE